MVSYSSGETIILPSSPAKTFEQRMVQPAMQAWEGSESPPRLSSHLAHGLAGDILGALELTAGEVAGGQRAEGLGHAGHAGGAVVLVDGDLRVGHQRLGELFLGLAEGFQGRGWGF